MKSDAIGLPAAELERYLSTHVAGFAGLKQIEKFSGGQSNPTFRLEADSGTYVLRRQPPGKLLKSAHAVDRSRRSPSEGRSTLGLNVLAMVGNAARWSQPVT